MANVRTSDTKDKARKVIVSPRNNEAYKEGYAEANGMKIPFDTPVVLAPNVIKALENQKEPVKVDGEETIYDIMEKFKVDMKKAAVIMQERKNQGLGSTIAWKRKYVVNFL